MNHNARKLVGTAQTAIRLTDVTAPHCLAHTTAVHDLPLPDHRLDDPHLESPLVPQSLQVRNIPLLPVTECEVGAYPELSHTKMTHQLFHETRS
jgi:hypothetical protein